jgi:hypothetical protein
MNRIKVVAVIIALNHGSARLAQAQPASPASAPSAPGVLSSPEARQRDAIALGLAFLSRQQNSEGAFDVGGAPKLAMTGLALMAFLADGHTPDDGRYGQTVRRALDYLIRSAPEDGYFGAVDGSRMYGHGIVTLALGEACGVDPDESSRAATRAILGRAVARILKAQDMPKEPIHAGGWRYDPEAGDSDLSLSGWNILALRAAGNAGIVIPQEHFVRARGYVLQCYNKLQRGFAYQPRQDASGGMTAIAVLDLMLLDSSAERPEVQQGIQFMVDHPITEATRFPYYTMYYTSQAAFQVGDPVWSAVWPAVRTRLLDQQQADGGWPQSSSGEEPGRIYATSMSVMTLTVARRLLPTYQR